MKKILTIVLALTLMFAMTVPAFAAISPSGGAITTTTGGAGNTEGGNDSPQSPQTGNPNWIVLAGGLLAAGAATAALASKKLSAKD